MFCSIGRAYKYLSQVKTLVAFTVIDADTCVGEFFLQNIGAMPWAIHPALHSDLRGIAVALKGEDVLAAGTPSDTEAVQALVDIAQARVTVTEKVAFCHVFAVIACGVGDLCVPSEVRQFRALTLFVDEAMHTLLQLA